MKTILFCAYLILGSVLASQSAMATALTIRGGVSHNNYELSNSDGNSWGATTQRGNSIGLKIPIDESSYFDAEASRGVGAYGISNYTGQITSSEYAVTYGNGFTHANGNLGRIYFGLKNSETKLTPDSTANAIAANANVIKLSSLGVVLGGIEAFPLGDGGYLTLSLALGAMKGQYDLGTVNSTNVTTLKADSASYYGFGIGYFYVITPGVSFSVDYKGQTYSYKFNADLPDEYRLKEKYGGFGGTLFIRF